MDQVKLQIDGQEVVVDKGTTIIKAAAKLGIDIPSLCYDPRLAPFGACRLCFVNVKDAPKPVTACSTEVAEGMVVTTEAENIAGLRKTALELLLSNHHGDCIAPCQVACPASIDIQGFLAYIADGKFEEASKLIKQQLPFPSSVGRVCPRFCEEACRRNVVDEPISICLLKAAAGDHEYASENPYTPEVKADTGKRIAVVGGGPAGLTAAYYARQEGHQVTIFDAEEKLGGMMRYGIPEYRLPKKVLDTEIQHILDLGIDVKYNTKMGKDFTLESLKKDGFDAIFVGIGCQKDTQVRLEGRESEGVYSGIEFLREIAYGREVELGNKVVIVGGGNTAMDAARTAVRLGVEEVTVVYRRTEKEMPADPREVEEAKEEGVIFKFLTNPKSIKADSKVKSVECLQMELGEPDESGRRRPVAIEGSEFDIDVDSVILAIGQGVDAESFCGCGELDLNRWDCVCTDESTLASNLEGVFAAGDCVLGASTVVEAVGQGKVAANSMIKYLNGEEVTADVEPYNCSRGDIKDQDPSEYDDVERQKRIETVLMAAKERKDNFKEIEPGFTDEEAMQEAGRCLSCGCKEAFDCRLRDLATRYEVEDKKLCKFGYQHPVITEDHPYIERDANKCVLCGNCIRICKEVQGISALGFVNRGLETVMQPAAELPLDKTMCVSCGQCVSACPTGALTSKVELPKQGPWKTEKVEAVCPNCGVGCNLELNVADNNKIVEITSSLDSEVNKGNLCVKGAFEYSLYDSNQRLEAPMVKDGVQLVNADWDSAVDKAAECFKSIVKEHGPESVAVLVSPKVTNEEAYVAQKIARDLLGTDNVDTVSCVPNDVAQFMLENKPQKGFNAIEESDFVFVYDTDLNGDYPVLANRVRAALNKGTKLGLVSSEDNELESSAQASLQICSSMMEEFLSSFNAFMKNCDAKEIPEDFAAEKDAIVELGKCFAEAKNPVIICDGEIVTRFELDLFKEFAKNAELIVMQSGNYFGLKLMGIDPNYNPSGKPAEENGLGFFDVIDGIKKNEIKGVLVVADEDGVTPEVLAEDIFAAVVTPVYQMELKNADVVLPGAAYPEKNGSYINAEGRKQFSSQAVKPLAGKDSWAVLGELASKLGCSCSEDKVKFEALSQAVQKAYEEA